MRTTTVRAIRMRLGQGVAFGFAAATALSARPAQAGNMDAFYLSGDAALQGGAIVADSRGGGAAWYNPAGLAELRGMRIDVSVNGYSVRFGGHADFDSPNPSAEVTRLTTLDLNVVPTALTFTKSFGDVGFAFGIFVPTQSLSALRTRLKVDGASRVDFAYDHYNRSQDYHVGPSLGWKPTPKLSLGASLLVNYRTSVSISDLFLSVGVANNSAVIATHNVVDWIQVGAEFVLGAQWNFAPDWRLGAVVRTPALRLGQNLQTIESTVAAGRNVVPQVDIEFAENFGLGATFIAPARAHLGLSHDIGDVRVAAEASMQMALYGDGLNLHLRPTPNARLGFRRRFSPIFSYGGGVFTDRSPYGVPSEFGESRIDYYGLTGAVSFATPYGIIQKGDVTFSQPRTMLFETTVAFSYATGIGTVMRARVDADQSDGIRYENDLANVFAHEFSVHLGTTVME